MVRIHPDPPGDFPNCVPVERFGRELRGCSSVGRAPALQAGGHRFDPVQLHQQMVSEGRLFGVHELSERLEASVKPFAPGLSISPKSTSVVL